MDLAAEVVAYQAQLEARRVARERSDEFELDEIDQIEEDTERAQAALEIAYLNTQIL
jgi:hypothetical protein